MKKILCIIILLLMFSVQVQAQKKSLSVQVQAQKKSLLVDSLTISEKILLNKVATAKIIKIKEIESTVKAINKTISLMKTKKIIIKNWDGSLKQIVEYINSYKE